MKSLKHFLQSKLQEDGSPDVNQDGILSPAELHQHLDIQKRGVVDMGDYAAHVMFHAHHPEYLAPFADKFNDVQKRHAAGEKLCENDPVLSKLENNIALKATNYPMYEGKTAKHKELDPPTVLVMRRKSVYHIQTFHSILYKHPLHVYLQLFHLHYDKLFVMNLVIL